MTYLWISLPYATFALRIEGGIVVTESSHIAPIAAWTKGKTREYVESYYRKKGATILRLELPHAHTR